MQMCKMTKNNPMEITVLKGDTGSGSFGGAVTGTASQVRQRACVQGVPQPALGELNNCET